MGCCNDCLTCDIAFNAVMPLSRASTRGRYSRIEGVTTNLSVFREAVSLARLVEAEIVSPYYGILINTDMGNPTVPSITALGG